MTASKAAFALDVIWDERTPAEHREWADRNYLREQMEVLAVKICKALYADGERSGLHEKAQIVLYLAPVSGGNVAIASLGAAREGRGKAVLLVAGPGRNALSVLVVASVSGGACGVVTSRRISIPGFSAGSHSVVLSVRGGEEAAVSVDGKDVAAVDMESKCRGCSFVPAFALGGMAGGVNVSQVAAPRGEKGVLLDDVRIFTRAFRPRETKPYAETFGPDFRGGVAAVAEWCGPQGARR